MTHDELDEQLTMPAKEYGWAIEILTEALENSDVLEAAKSMIRFKAKQYGYEGDIEFKIGDMVTRSYEERHKILFWRKKIVEYQTTYLLGKWWS